MEIQRPTQCRLVPPFQKGDGKDGSVFTLFVEGGTPHVFAFNDVIVVEGFMLKVVDYSKRPDQRLLEEFYTLDVRLVADILNKFTITDYRNAVIIKSINFRQPMFMIPDPTSAIKIIP